MLRRITKKSDSTFTLDETAQEIRQFEKHLTDNMENGEHREGFEYACELIGNMLNEKIEELEKDCKHFFIPVENEKVSGVKICIHCKEIEIG